MGSVTSCFNLTLFRKNLARFWPIWGLYTLFWVVLLPVGVLLRRSYWDKGLARAFPLDLMDDGNPTLLLAVFFGILCAMAVFSYLYSARSVGMLHALPMRREGLFLTNYLSGLAFLWVPNFGVFLLALAAEALNGAVVFSSLFTWLVVCSLMCLFFFSFAVFCAMFTGHLLALPAFYGILSLLASALASLIQGIAREFLFGFDGASWLRSWAMWLSPAFKLLQDTGMEYSADGNARYCGLGLVVLYALVGLVLAGLALVLYNRRHLERAGDVITVGWVRPVFQYGTALCSAIALGSFFYSIFYTLLPQRSWTLLGWMVLWGAAGCFIAAMLLQKRFQVFKSCWRGCLTFLLCLVAAMCTLELDVIGFENRVPDAAQVKAVSVSGVSSTPYDSGSRPCYMLDDPDLIRQVTALHAAITDRKEALEAWAAQPDKADEWYSDETGADLQSSATEQVELLYQLTDGSILRRAYTIPVTGDTLADPADPAALLSGLINRPDVVYQTYLGQVEEEDRLVDACLVNLYDPEEGSYGFEYLPSDLLQPLLEAIEADIRDGNLGRRYLLEDRQRMDNCCYADLELTFRTPSGGAEGSAAVAPSTQAAGSDTYTVTITLQKSALRTLEVLKDYPHALLSRWEYYRLTLS